MVIRRDGDTVMILCSRGMPAKPQTCFYCGKMGGLLCDFPVGNGQTCDRSVCPKHSKRVASETDYCMEHVTAAQGQQPSGEVG